MKKQNELALAQANYEVEKKKAETLRDTNKITSAGLTPEMLAYRALEVQEKMADNDKAVFVPYESLGSSGLSNRIFK